MKLNGLFKPNIAKLEANRDIQKLTKALGNSDDDVRQKAARALGNIRDFKAVNPLENLIAKEERWWVKIVAIESLGNFKDPNTVDIFRSAINDKSLVVRIIAVEALCKIENECVIDSLGGALKDKEKSVRDIAEQALAKLDNPKAKDLISEFRKQQQSEEDARKLLLEKERKLDEERNRLISSNILRYFVKDNKGAWDHQEWLELTNNVKSSGYAILSDDDIERLLEAEKKKFLDERKRKFNREVTMQPRYMCNNCGALQEDGAWERTMDARAKAIGSKGFINLSATPECLNCGSTDLEDRSRPMDEAKRHEKDATKQLPDRTRILELMKEWDNIDRPTLDEIKRLGHTQQVFDRHMKAQAREEEIGNKIREMGRNLADRGGQELLYQICTSFERRDWQNRISAFWDGIAGWMH